MSTVLHFRKELSAPPVARAAAPFSLHPLATRDNIAAWLALRDRAMAGQSPRVRRWAETDFHAEMTAKPWWTPDCTWLATHDETGPLVGAVTLALREGTSGSAPVVHWLLVDPLWRRRGVGRLLISRLELAAWNAGWREVQLETHAGWREAVAFYQSMGYAPARERSPR